MARKFVVKKRGMLRLLSIQPLDGDDKLIAKMFRDAGYAVTARDIQRDMDKIVQRSMRSLSQEALDVYRANAPRRSGELEEEHIEAEYTNEEAHVYVDARGHTSYGERKYPVEAAGLADLLNLGGPDGEWKTRNWVSRAFSVFKAAAPEALAKNRTLQRNIRRR